MLAVDVRLAAPAKWFAAVAITPVTDGHSVGCRRWFSRSRSRAVGGRALSGRMAVLVHKSAQDVDAVDPPNLGEARRLRLTVGGGHAQVDAPMGPGGVVVLHVHGEHLF